MPSEFRGQLGPTFSDGGLLLSPAAGKGTHIGFGRPALAFGSLTALGSPSLSFPISVTCLVGPSESGQKEGTLGSRSWRKCGLRSLLAKGGCGSVPLAPISIHLADKPRSHFGALGGRQQRVPLYRGMLEPTNMSSSLVSHPQRVNNPFSLT